MDVPLRVAGVMIFMKRRPVPLSGSGAFSPVLAFHFLKQLYQNIESQCNKYLGKHNNSSVLHEQIEGDLDSLFQFFKKI